MRRWLVLSLVAAWGCAGGAAPSAAPAVPGATKAPYDATPEARVTIGLAIDAKPARQILESLARPRMDPADAKVLQDLPAVAAAIRDSSRTSDVFERDFAAAFQNDTRPAVFDFKSVRDRRDRWQPLLDGILARQTELTRLSQSRAASLLPGDAAVSVKLDVDFTFALAGIEDDLVVQTPGGTERMIIDVAKALSESEGGTVDAHISRLARLIGGEACRLAWNAYRETSPAWRKTDPQLGQLDPLLKIVAAASPIGLFGIDESFFPLSAWLKDPMKRALDDLNHRAEQFAQAQENLEARMGLAAELRRPDFGRRVAAPIGAFLADAIAEDAGPAGLRAALQQGPRAFFAAYDRAAQKRKELTPLGKAIRDKLK